MVELKELEKLYSLCKEKYNEARELYNRVKSYTESKVYSIVNALERLEFYDFNIEFENYEFNLKEMTYKKAGTEECSIFSDLNTLKFFAENLEDIIQKLLEKAHKKLKETNKKLDRDIKVLREIARKVIL